MKKFFTVPQLDITHEDQEVHGLEFKVLPTISGHNVVQVKSDTAEEINAWVARQTGIVSIEKTVAQDLIKESHKIAKANRKAQLQQEIIDNDSSEPEVI